MLLPSVCCRKSPGKRFNHVYPVTANKLSDSAFKFTCQDTWNVTVQIWPCFSLSVVSLEVCLSVLQPALLKAIFNVDPDEVRSLIFKKEDVNVQVRKKKWLDFKLIHLIFKLVHLIINKLYFFQDNEKRTPLHAAAYLGDAEIIELLILSGKCIWSIHHNEKKIWSSSYLLPLIPGVFKCGFDVLLYCYSCFACDVGARVNAKDNKWLTPLHRAVASCSEVLQPQRHILGFCRVCRNFASWRTELSHYHHFFSEYQNRDRFQQHSKS